MIEKMQYNMVIHGDCIAEMKKIPTGVVNLIICDPPYNLQLNNDLIRPNDGSIFDGVDDSWDSFHSMTSYDDFTTEWLTEARRILHNDGTIMVMGMYHNIFSVGNILHKLGYWILNDIIWEKCLAEDTYIYARTPLLGECPVLLKDVINNDIQNTELWNGISWIKIKSYSKVEDNNALEIKLSSGECISSTKFHKWPTERGVVYTKDLVIGDKLTRCKLPDQDKKYDYGMEYESIRYNVSEQHNVKDNNEIIRIQKSNCIKFIDITLENEPHTFALASGVLTHNCNPTPNFTGKRLCNSHETIIWAAKSSESKYFFNYHFMKNFNGGKQMRSDWILPICSGKERILDDNGIKVHSTQKPIELMQRLVLMASKVDSIVMDPMCGTGTALAAAKMYNRKYIGIDSNSKYVNVSNKRLQNVAVDNDLLKTESDIQIQSKPVRVPFKTIIDDGKIDVGTQIRFHKTPTKPMEEFATIILNGNVIYNGEELSIHKAACKILKRSSANGWKYWYYNDTENGYKCIDELRKGYK